MMRLNVEPLTVQNEIDLNCNLCFRAGIHDTLYVRYIIPGKVRRTSSSLVFCTTYGTMLNDVKLTHFLLETKSQCFGILQWRKSVINVFSYMKTLIQEYEAEYVYEQNGSRRDRQRNSNCAFHWQDAFK